MATVLFAGASHGQSEMSLAEREPVRIFFQTVYEASEGIPSGWTGNVALGEAGSTSPAFQRAVGVRINYFRAMAGVPASVALSSSYSTPDQWAALLVSANSQLSHYPTAAWKDYTAPGAAAAADSNLILGVDGPAAVDAYIQDAGATNYFVGHRRWVLYPQTRKMGTGDIDADPTGTYPAANALWVLDGMFGTARPATRDGFVAWPPPGYVPEQLIYNRWSLAYPEADFSQARVQMSRGGKSVSRPGGTAITR